jgi:hypothetical protein
MRAGASARERGREEKRGREGVGSERGGGERGSCTARILAKDVHLRVQTLSTVSSCFVGW